MPIFLALVLWKVADIGAGLIDLSENALRLITLGLIILFPIAMLMAWLYERSPQGFVRTGSAAAWENPFSDEQKKPITSNTFVILLFATVAALFLLVPQSSTMRVASEGFVVDKSIAVLPFKNMSQEPGSQYFADGVMEAILNNLCKIKDLKVISRTSVEQYRSSTKTAPEIGQELDVVHILEGSVQQYKDKVRITVQLIDSRQDKHLWSENYDRQLTDIFVTQSEIAQKIAGALQATLTPRKRRSLKPSPPTTSTHTIFISGPSSMHSDTKTKLKARITIML